MAVVILIMEPVQEVITHVAAITPVVVAILVLAEVPVHQDRLARLVALVEVVHPADLDMLYTIIGGAIVLIAMVLSVLKFGITLVVEFIGDLIELIADLDD